MSVGRKLKGRVVEVQRTGEKILRGGENWEKCVFTLELTRFSGRDAMPIPSLLRGKVIKLVRFCLYDWHFEKEVEKSLEPGETVAVIEGKPTQTVYW